MLMRNFFISSFRTLDESIRWLIAKNRWSEAKRLIKKAANVNDVDYSYVAYLFRHFDPEDGEESQKTSGDPDMKTEETEMGSVDCSVSGQMIKNTESEQLARNEAKELGNTFTEVVGNTKSEKNRDSFAEQENFDGEEKMEEMKAGLNCAHTERDRQISAHVVENEEIKRREKKVRNGRAVGVSCPDSQKHVPALDASETDQMDVSSVVGKGGVVELLSLSTLLEYSTPTSSGQRAQKLAIMQCKLPGMLYIIKEPVLRRMVFICLYLW